MIKQNYRKINKDSTLGELRSYNESVAIDLLGERLANYFDAKPDLPGILVIGEDQFLGLISRDYFYEKVGRRYGVEIFLHREVRFLLENYPYQSLVLPSSTLINDAVERALKRKPPAVYEPIVVQWGRNQFSILDVLTLFVAQNYIMKSLNAQRYYTVQNGLPMSDEEAISVFREHIGVKDHEYHNLHQSYSVQCDRCNQKIPYRIVDIVRSFPDVTKGILIDRRMGSIFFTFYIRHRCGDTIVEIPVQHDQQLNFRNRRNQRVIETDA